AAPARRVIARASLLRRVAQAPRAVALLHPLRGARARTRRTAGGLGRGVDALAFTTAGHTAGGPEERRAMIQSLLDTDLYKFTMMQGVLHQYPAAQASYRFRCRSPGVDL